MQDIFDVTIIGAGIIGLAAAKSASEAGFSVCVVERHESFGKETSSRNSEVIHSGIYYPQNTLKARFCVEGKRLLYDICMKNNIPFRNTGKFIVACVKEEIGELNKLHDNAEKNGVNDLRLVTKKELNAAEPNVNAIAALHCPSTGIVDSHSLMKYFEYRAKEKGTIFSYNADLQKIVKEKDGFELVIKDNGEDFSFKTRTVVNCAGLDSDKIASMAGLDVDKAGCRLYFCKGDYFNVSNRKELAVNGLVYPVPHLASGGLGVHITVDLQGCVRLGPDTEYVNRIYYDVDPAKQKKFFDAARRYLPALKFEDISPGTSGMRPKLTKPNEVFRDFYIKHEDKNNLEGFINLVGIESPGLTASPAIGIYTSELLKNILN